MLVLTRKPKEVIQIGDNITVTIVRIKGQTVRVGINAPRDIRVIRGELTAFDDEPNETSEASETVPSEPSESNPSETVAIDLGQQTAKPKLNPQRPCAPRLPKSDRFQNRKPGLTAFGLLAARERARREQSQLDS